MREEFAKLYKEILSCAKEKECDKKAGGDRCEELIDPGYLGPDYKKEGILVVGLNPGCPKKKSSSAEKTDEKIRDLKEGNSPLLSTFEEIMKMLKEDMKGWEIWENMNRDAVGLKPLFSRIPEIAYTNLVKCAWSKDKKNIHPVKEHFESCAEWFKKQVEILEPKLIIFLGEGTFYWAKQIFQSDSLIQKYLKSETWVYHPSHPENYRLEKAKRQRDLVLEKINQM